MKSIHIDRGMAAAQGREAVQITRQGRYRSSSGRVVHLADHVTSAIAGTVSYAPQHAVPRPSKRFEATRITVENDTTLASSQRLVQAGRDVAALNFASAKNPGGGFLGGARAQEESICRASALFACIDGRDMYAYHRQHHDTLYATWVLYSPGVPVFRGDDGDLLEEPFRAAFLTSPAPNAGVVLERDPSRRGEVHRALAERVDRVLAIAAAHGHDALVLGAWGCGVFRNDPDDVASLFAEALGGPFRGVFSDVVFAVVDEWADRRNIGPFERRFGRAVV